jgi:cyclophilin family peptidyl-prolyl cis-trans isomerase/protein-disulfide isomerase
MRKLSGLLLSALMIFTTACASSTSSNATPRPTATPANLIVKSEKTLVSKCTYSGVPSTPKAGEPSLFAPVSSQDHVRGPADAYLTVLVYSDFQCPACAPFAALLAQIQAKHPQDIRIVHRSFPLLTIDDKAALSTQAAEAANLQGKFWEMHDLLFSKQADWVKLDTEKFQAWVVEQAATLGLDQAKFKTDLTSPEMVDLAKKAWDTGMKIPLPGVPFILVNGEILKWQPTLFNNLENILKLDLLPKKQFSSCPPVVIDASKQYFATLKTAKGDIVIHLFADKAPNTVNNFVFLARRGWYDNNTFQRVVPGFIAQTGDPSGTGQGNPGYFIPDELGSNLKYDRPGVVGMSNSGSGTNGSQFFITYAAAAKLNGQYTVFGEVLKGMDVLNHLTPRDAIPGQTLPDGDALMTVSIEEK